MTRSSCATRRASTAMLTRRLNGQTIMLSADSHDYINPMDIELEENMDDVLRLKSELILSFCEIVMDGKRNIPQKRTP